AWLWWHFARYKGKYESDEDSDCCVLAVQIDAAPEEFLDATEQEFIEIISESALSDRIAEPEDVGPLFARVIQNLEVKTCRKFAVVRAFVPTPPRAKGRELTPVELISKQSRCYVLRHHRNDLIASLELCCINNIEANHG